MLIGLAGASGALNVTPSAVSHLPRALEQTPNLPLLTANVRPTETGERPGRWPIAAFDAIGSAIADARHQEGDIRISALSSYLTLWLVPRLADRSVTTMNGAEPNRKFQLVDWLFVTDGA